MRERVSSGVLLCGFVLMVLGGCGGARRANPLPPPSFRPFYAWLALTTGTSNALQESPPSVWAIPAGSNLAALAPFNFPANLLHLSRDGIYISASTDGRGGPDKTFRPAEWPLRLSGFRLDHGWEGQPAPNVLERLRWAAVHGWHLDVRVYFATQHPTHRLLREAQQQLDRLRLPGS